MANHCKAVGANAVPQTCEAPEPLCWRKMENTAGLTVAAADVLFWKHSLDSKDNLHKWDNLGVGSSCQ